MSGPTLYRFKKGTTVKDLTDFCISEVAARNLLAFKSFPDQYEIRLVPGGFPWGLPNDVTEPIPTRVRKSRSTATVPRWRVYPKEKPTREDAPFIIGRVKRGKLNAITHVETTSGVDAEWPLWMRRSEALTLFPTVPKS